MRPGGVGADGDVAHLQVRALDGLPYRAPRLPRARASGAGNGRSSLMEGEGRRESCSVHPSC